MSEHSVLYNVLDEEITSAAKLFDGDVPYHTFSRRYMRKEKAIFKAYLRSKEKQEPVEKSYHKQSVRKRMMYALIAIIAAILLAGFTIYITHYIDSMRINEYDTHSFAFALDSENDPKTLENRYEITYDLSCWNKEIIDDDNYDFWEIYKFEDDYISFSYHVKSSYQGVRYNTEGSEPKNVIIGNINAFFFISPDGVSCLTWDKDDYIFEFDFTIDYNIAEKIIETIIKT